MSLKGNLFHIHNQSSKLIASNYVEDEGKNDVNNVIYVIDEKMKWRFD